MKVWLLILWKRGDEWILWRKDECVLIWLWWWNIAIGRLDLRMLRVIKIGVGEIECGWPLRWRDIRWWVLRWLGLIEIGVGEIECGWPLRWRDIGWWVLRWLGLIGIGMGEIEFGWSLWWRDIFCVDVLRMLWWYDIVGVDVLGVLWGSDFVWINDMEGWWHWWWYRLWPLLHGYISVS